MKFLHSFTSRFIQKMLSLLVLLAILPALSIIFYSGIELRHKAIEGARREVMFLAQTMGEIQKGITLSTHQTLATLARMDEIKNMNGLAASAIFRALVEENPAFINIAAVNIEGDVFASAKPFEAINLSDRAHFQKALHDKAFVAGEYIITRVGQTVQSLAFAYPVLNDSGHPVAVLTTALNLEHFAYFFGAASLPENSFFAVIDRNGTRLFFYPRQEGTNPVGGSVISSAWDTARNAQTPGISNHVGSDGVRRIFAYNPVRISEGQTPYMYMWVGIPEALVLKPANMLLARNLLMMFIVAGLALLVVRLLGGRGFLTPINRLISVSRGFAGGDLNARSGMGNAPGELGILARAFDDMADALVENQRQLRTIADYTYDWEYWKNPDGSLRWVSPSCEKITGYAPGEFMTDKTLLKRIVHEKDVAHFDSNSVQMPGEFHIRHIDFRILHKSGKTVWIDHHCQPLIKENGAFWGWRVSNRDITGRKRIEQALRESEMQFRSLIEGAPDAIFVQSNRCFAYVNDAALLLFGAKSADQLIGTPILDRIHSDFHKQVKDRIEQLNVWKKKTPRVQHIYLRLDGSHFPVEVSAVPINFKGADGALVFVQDITERRRIEARLQQSQKMEAIGSLAGGIAHDFNNILSPIMGLSEMLLKDLPRGSLEHKNVAEIYMASRRARDLVNQILSFSRQAEHQKIPLRIQQVLKEVGKLFRATIPSFINIHMDIQADCGPVLADPTNMHQVAMNLITNAFHAIEENGGSITIKLEQTILSMDDLADTVLESGPYVLLKVSDTGQGIPPDLLNKIFDPYFTTKTKDKGTGLGLSLVYGIVREHGGDISIFSESGKGTAFSVYLPLLERDDMIEPTDKAPAYPIGVERILVVDDEAAIVDMEAQMLRRLGYDVTPHTNSAEAFKAFSANPGDYDLVITDMAMPNMNGEELARRLIDIREDIAVILCTGFSETMTSPKAASIGIKAFLNKPVSLSDMASAIRHVLDDANSVKNRGH